MSSYKRTVGNLSLVAGTKVCNASCPFCVSSMTPDADLKKKIEPIDFQNFASAVGMAVASSAGTALICKS